MKYLCLDIETTDLEPKYGSILQVAGIVVDAIKPLPSLKELENRGLVFNVLIKHDLRELRGSYTALEMNAALIKQTQIDGVPENVAQAKWINFLERHLERNFDKTKFTVAGKNVGSFDVIWLREKGWVTPFRVSVLDPGVLYFNPQNDNLVPHLSEIAKRIGATYKEHNALEDAYVTALALQKKFVN